MSAVTQAATEAASKARAKPQQPLHVVQIADALLRIRTVEALTAQGKSSIYALIARGDFPEPVRRGSRWSRWKSSDITAWLQAQGKEV
jgi:prophage regulatory protein